MNEVGMILVSRRRTRAFGANNRRRKKQKRREIICAESYFSIQFPPALSMLGVFERVKPQTVTLSLTLYVAGKSL